MLAWQTQGLFLRPLPRLFARLHPLSNLDILWPSLIRVVSNSGVPIGARPF